VSVTTTVFVVDDDDSVRRAMSRLMRAAGFKVLCYGSIDALLEKSLPSSGAVILADVDTARRFATAFPDALHACESPLPVIYLTGFDTDRMRHDAVCAGAAGLFRKPVDEQALVDAIEFAVGQSGQQGSY
jgi:FixJ family two-component response regulator